MQNISSNVEVPKMNKQGNTDTHDSATMFPEVDKHGNIDRKHNVSATMFS